MNYQLWIAFGARAVENYSKAPKQIKAMLTTEHAASSYGLPVVVIDGEAYGPADLNAMHEGFHAVLQCDSIPTVEFYGTGNAKEMIEQAGYMIGH